MHNGFTQESKVTFERIWCAISALRSLIVTLHENMTYWIAMLIVGSIGAHKGAEAWCSRQTSKFLEFSGCKWVQRLLVPTNCDCGRIRFIH